MDILYISPERQNSPSILTCRQERREYNLSIVHTGITSHRRESNSGSTQPGGHRHSVYHLLLYLGRDNEFLFDGKVRKSPRGTLAVCSPGNTHSFLPRLPGENSYAEITFEYTSRERRLELPCEELLSALMSRKIRLPDGLYTLTENEIHRFLELFHSHFTLLQDGSSTLFDRHLKMAEIFRFTGGLGESAEEIPASRKIRDRIHSSLPGQLNLDILSREFNRSKAWLISEFKGTYGVTPMEYFRRTRLSMASDILRTSDRTLEDIAALFGYCDVFHFMKAFKKEYGISPGKYRHRNLFDHLD